MNEDDLRQGPDEFDGEGKPASQVPEADGSVAAPPSSVPEHDPAVREYDAAERKSDAALRESDAAERESAAAGRALDDDAVRELTAEVKDSPKLRRATLFGKPFGKPFGNASGKPFGRPWIRNLTTQAQFVLLAMTIALFIITFVVQAFRIPSGSMEDTLLVGDYLLVDKTRFGPAGWWQSILPYRGIHRGEIVVFRHPVDPAEHFVKRVIGLPGDRVRLWHSRVYINGKALTEPYVVFKEHYHDEFRDEFPRGNWINENVSVEWRAQSQSLVRNGELMVPPGCYFVLGDNRDQSLDSRYWGFVPRESIIGRPLLIYFSMAGMSEDDEGDVARAAADDKLLTLRARISHALGDLRWRRILRLAP